MIPKNSLVVYTYDDCHEVGLYIENKDGEEWGFWIKDMRQLYTSMGGLIVTAPPVLGKWND